MFGDLNFDNLIRPRRADLESRRRERRRGWLLVVLAVLIIAALLLWGESARTEPVPAANPTSDPTVGAAPSSATASGTNVGTDTRADGAAVGWDWTETREEYDKRINDFLTWYFANVDPRKLASAREVVPVLLDVAEAERVNPSLVAAIITCESSWRAGVRGGLGEVGLMQINRRGVSHEPAENIRAGIAMLRTSFARCGTIEGAVAYYATGSSCRWKGAARRVQIAARIEQGQ